MNKRAVLNVGGERHEVLWRTLEQIPYSRLGGKTSCIFNKCPILLYLQQIPYSCLGGNFSCIFNKLSSIAGKLAVASSHESVMEQADYYSLIGETPLVPCLLSLLSNFNVQFHLLFTFLCYSLSVVIQFPLLSNFHGQTTSSSLIVIHVPSRQSSTTTERVVSIPPMKCEILF